MLGCYDHGMNPIRFAVYILHSHLGFPVRSQPREFFRLANMGQSLGKSMREIYGHRHECLSVLTGETEHESLIASSLLLKKTLTIDAHGNVGGLFVDRRKNCACLPVKPHR